MNAPTRRDFLGLAQNAAVATAVGVIAVRFLDVAEAMPVAPAPGPVEKRSDLATEVQWGPGWGPGPGPGWGWGPPPPRRRRRRVCWWRRGRRVCGWRWV